MSNITVGTIQSNTAQPPIIQNSSGTEIGTMCRAWVNFNGTGTVTIRASFGINSITDNGVGVYKANFTTAVKSALPDVNYAVVGFKGGQSADVGACKISNTVPDADGVTINSYDSANAVNDTLYFYLAIFR